MCQNGIFYERADENALTSLLGFGTFHFRFNFFYLVKFNKLIFLI